jgi:hypothetical protein
MPREWLRAGSFILRPEQDPLAGLGGCAKAAPAEGDEATADGRTCRFERVPPGEVGPSGVAVRAADEGPMGTEQFYFTWLDNRAGSRCFRATLSGVADQAWIGGEPVEHFGLVSVRGCGVVPVLIRVRFPGDLPPFRRQGSFLFVLDEEADPDETFRAQVERIRRNESALRRVLELAPNTREATRAQYLLSFVPAP